MKNCACGRHRGLRSRVLGSALTVALFALVVMLAVGSVSPADIPGFGKAELTGSSSLPASKAIGVNPPAGNFYSYAPSTVEQGNTRHVFYCGNKDSGQVHDNVMLSVGTKTGDKWSYGQPRVAFGPSQTAPAWTNYHMCDPEAIRGQFMWNGHTYPWAILFTAYGCPVQTAPCPADKEVPNQLGVAFSDSLDASPAGWKVYPTPLISYDMDFGGKCPPGDYCIGEPSATSIDGAGRFLLFYQTKGGFVRREIDLANVTAPVIGGSQLLSAEGLPDWLHNASVVYSPTRDRFFISYDAGVWNKDPQGPPVQTDTVIASIEGPSIWSGTGTWRVEETITPAHSGHAFNHNSGIVHSPAGTTVSDSLEVIHTVGNGWTYSGGWGVWTYRLWANTYPLPTEG